MKSIDEFYHKHSNEKALSINSIASSWEQEKQIDELLNTTVGNGVVLGDLMVGDGLQDQISKPLYKAFHELMGEKAETCNQIRQRLLDYLANGQTSVLGTVNKIKGQLAENWFVEQAKSSGLDAHLADLGNQEGWDVAINHVHGATQYVQVKMYSNPPAIVEQIRQVNEKLNIPGKITNGGRPIHSIDFAIPKDAIVPVKERLQELDIHTKLIPMNHTPQEAAQVVQDGFNNVGPEALHNFFGQLLGTAVTAAALHGLTQTFLVWKGSKNGNEFLENTTLNTSVTVAGASVGMTVETILYKTAWIGHAVPAYILVFSASMATRSTLKRILSRRNYVSWLHSCNENLSIKLQQLSAQL